MATMFSGTSVAPAVFETAPPLLPKDIALAITALATALFLNHEPNLGSGRGRLVAVTSPTGGEGVTTITCLLALQLARNPTCRVLLASPAQLEHMPTSDPVEVENLLRKNPVTGTWSFEAKPLRTTPVNNRWTTQVAFRRALLDTLRDSFDYLLLDCPAVNASADVTQLAMLVDGVLLVVSAGSSTQHQISQAWQIIENSGGTLEGCCLNRQNSPTPHFINRLLGR